MLVVMDKEPLHPRLKELSKLGFGIKVWKDTEAFDSVNLKLIKGAAEWHYLFTKEDWLDFLEWKAVEPKLMGPTYPLADVDAVLDFFKPKDSVEMIVPVGSVKPGDLMQVTGGPKPGLYTVDSVKGSNITVKPKLSVNDLKTKKSWEKEVMNYPPGIEPSHLQTAAQKHLSKVMGQIQKQGVLPPKMLIGFDPIAMPAPEVFKQEQMGSFPDVIKELEEDLKQEVEFDKKFSGSKHLIPKSYAELKGMGGPVPPRHSFMGELEGLLQKHGVRVSRPEVRAALEHLRQVCATAVEEDKKLPAGRFVDLSDDT